MESLRRDIRSGVSALAKSPGFTAVALLTLAFGIGANTAMFTALNAVLLRALPVDSPQGLMILSDPAAHGIGVGDGTGKRYLSVLDFGAADRSQSAVLGDRSCLVA